MPRPKTTLKSEYPDLFGDLSSYFAVYGGWRKIVYSPYTHAALIITILCWSKWHGENWAATPLAVLPPLLGFTLAAYALFLGFGDESFRKFLANIGRPEPGGAVDTHESILMGVSAIFVHFVVVQVFALICVIVGETNPFASLGWSNGIAIALERAHIPAGTPHDVGAFIGLWAFNLSIFMAFAAAIDIYHATGWYVRYTNKKRKAGSDS